MHEKRISRTQLIATAFVLCGCQVPDQTTADVETLAEVESGERADEHHPLCFEERILGTLGGATTVPYALNNRGQVVGTSDTPSGEAHAFLWQNGEMRDLGTLGGSTSRAVAINESGEIVGDSAVADGSAHPFIWYHHRLHDLEVGIGTAADINDRGQVVGVAEGHGFLWEHGIVFDIGAVAQVGHINRRGEVLGSLAVNAESPFVWRRGHLIALPIINSSTVANTFNDDGTVVGWSLNADGRERVAIRWRHEVLEELPSLGGHFAQAAWINDRGQIAGRAVPAIGGAPHAVLWDRGRIIDLTPTETRNLFANGINNRGLVIGAYSASNPGGFAWWRGRLVQLPGKPSRVNDRGEIIGNDGGVAVLWEPTACDGVRMVPAAASVLPVESPN